MYLRYGDYVITRPRREDAAERGDECGDSHVRNREHHRHHRNDAERLEPQ